MPPFIAAFAIGAVKRLSGLVDWLIETRAGRITLACIIAAIGLLIWTKHVEHKATKAVLAQVEAATAAEHDRREKIEAWAQQWAAGSIKRTDDLNATLAKLQQQNATSSAAGDGDACFTRDDVDRFNGMLPSNRR